MSRAGVALCFEAGRAPGVQAADDAADPGYAAVEQHEQHGGKADEHSTGETAYRCKVLQDIPPLYISSSTTPEPRTVATLHVPDGTGDEEHDQGD